MLARTSHPGEILKDELAELGVTPTALARQIDVPAKQISQIIAGERSMTGDTALRLGHWFGMAPLFWMQLQTAHDLALAERIHGDDIRRLPRRMGFPASDQASHQTAGVESDKGSARPADCQVIGSWRILESDTWDRDYLNLVEPARIEIQSDGHGEIVFGCVQAGLEVDYSHSIVFFQWFGCDEGDEVDGTGSAELMDDGSLEIELSFSQGDEAVFKACRQ